ncbi:MAG: CPBP family intramembrane metalloprotease [Firmicutes bacterium]|nr:CPBP family intramembrane metalloprotease [Bacillota bacterium]
MKKIFIAAGWIAMYLFIYLMANIIVGLGLILVYMFSLFGERTTMHPMEFLFENFMPMMLAASVLAIILYYLIFIIRGVNLNKYTRLKKMPAIRVAVSALMGAGIALLLNGILPLVEIEQILPTDLTDLDALLTSDSFILTLLTVGIVVPIFEELLFRGLIFKALKWAIPLWPALILQGLVFGAIHLNWFQFIYAFPLGIYLGVIYLQFRSLWAPILVHLFWNSTSVVLSFISPDQLTLYHLLVWAAVGLLLVALAMTLYYTRARNWRPGTKSLE